MDFNNQRINMSDKWRKIAFDKTLISMQQVYQFRSNNRSYFNSMRNTKTWSQSDSIQIEAELIR